jgi:L-threonylcarbamoyladenylate synthase
VDKLPAHIDEILKSDLATTIIYPKGKGLAKGVISTNGSVALRIPRACFALELINAFGKPIVSTSANISDWPIPKSYSDIHPSILEQVDEVVPLDKEKVAQLPSRILQLLPDGTFITLR